MAAFFDAFSELVVGFVPTRGHWDPRAAFFSSASHPRQSQVRIPPLHWNHKMAKLRISSSTKRKQHMNSKRGSSGESEEQISNHLWRYLNSVSKEIENLLHYSGLNTDQETLDKFERLTRDKSAASRVVDGSPSTPHAKTDHTFGSANRWLANRRMDTLWNVFGEPSTSYNAHKSSSGHNGVTPYHDASNADSEVSLQINSHSGCHDESSRCEQQQQSHRQSHEQLDLSRNSVTEMDNLRLQHIVQQQESPSGGLGCYVRPVERVMHAQQVHLTSTNPNLATLDESSLYSYAIRSTQFGQPSVWHPKITKEYCSYCDWLYKNAQHHLTITHP